MLAQILSTRPTLDPYGGFGTAEEQQKDAVDRALEADAPFESASVIGNVRMDATIFCLTGRGSTSLLLFLSIVPGLRASNPETCTGLILEVLLVTCPFSSVA